MDLDFSGLKDQQRSTGAWAAALMLALARDEAAGRRPARLTEARLATWNRFRGRLKATDLLALLFEDAAVVHPVPFDPARIQGQFDLNQLAEDRIASWLDAISSLDLNAPGTDYLLDQACLLGVPTRFARSELLVVKPHQRVLELPGTGGQLSHYLVKTIPGLALRDNFTVACSNWREATLAGIAALDLGASSSDFITSIDPELLKAPEHPLRQRVFDVVIGPDRGGIFRVENQLAIWFPSARIQLV
jgi:hypothetical protein